jgi:hypothetical protein
MKNLMTILFTGILFCFYLSFPTIASATSVSITDKKGITTNADEFKSHRHDGCKGFIYYSGVSTETDFYWDFLPINTGKYIVRIPFSIIKRIKVDEEADPKKKYQKSYVYKIYLADNSTLQGTAAKISEFTGESDLGKFKISTNGVREIIFQQEPKASFNATPKGNYTANLILSGNSSLLLKGATFVKEAENKNGCYTGEGYPSFMEFQTGESKYEIRWDKIAEIVFVKAKKKNSKNFKLVTNKRSEYVGSASNLIGIEGITKIGGYNLRVIVPFDSEAIKLVFEN